MNDDEVRTRLDDALTRAKTAIAAAHEAADVLQGIVRLVVRPPPTVLYFGPAYGHGHVWSVAGGGHQSSSEAPIDVIDGVFAPKPRDNFHSDTNTKMGVARTVLVSRCTVVQWWDSSVDHRGACNSSFVARGVHTFDEMITAGRVQHPKVLEVFRKYYGRDVVSE